jgi:hypothetical protein
MAVGILTKDTTLYSVNGFEIKMPKGTVVFMDATKKSVIFKDMNVRCVYSDGYWYAIVFGERMRLIFPKGGVCYPFIYFRDLEVKNA